MEALDRNTLVAAHGTDVVDVDGDKIGAVEDIYYDDATGRAEWVGIGVGIFGLKRRVVPVEGARLEGDCLRVPYEKDMVKDSPDVDGDEISPDREAELYAYYGVTMGRDRTGMMDTGTSGTTDLGTAGVGATDADLDRAETGRMRLHRWVETDPAQGIGEVREERAEVAGDDDLRR